MKPTFVFLTVLVIVLLPAMNAQQHAPTPDVCRADLAVWGNHAAELAWFRVDTPDRAGNSNESSKTVIDMLSFKEISSRILEMGDCQSVDPARENSYFETMSFYQQVQGSRYLHFIERHNLMVQFGQDDDAGKR
jgi:hypothetical protein